MPETLIVIADRARARIFELERPEEPLLGGGPRLLELEDLIEPDGRLAPREQFSNLKSGRSGSPRGVPEHSFDDHREGHLAEVTKRFARRTAQAVGHHLEAKQGAQIVLFAAPQLLGVLRQEFQRLSLDEKCVADFSEDLSRHTKQDIEKALVQKGVIREAHSSPSAQARRSR